MSEVSREYVDKQFDTMRDEFKKIYAVMSKLERTGASFAGEIAKENIMTVLYDISAKIDLAVNNSNNESKTTKSKAKANPVLGKNITDFFKITYIENQNAFDELFTSKKFKKDKILKENKSKWSSKKTDPEKFKAQAGVLYSELTDELKAAVRDLRKQKEDELKKQDVETGNSDTENADTASIADGSIQLDNNDTKTEDGTDDPVEDDANDLTEEKSSVKGSSKSTKSKAKSKSTKSSKKSKTTKSPKSKSSDVSDTEEEDSDSKKRKTKSAKKEKKSKKDESDSDSD